MEGRELPVGWVDAPLLGLGELIRGVTYSKNDSSDRSFSGSIPILRANNIQDRHFDTANLVHVPTSLVAQTQIVKAGDVVIATSSGSISVVGKAAQAREDFAMAFGAFCGLIRPSNEISPEYFGHFFSSEYYRTAVSDMARGVNINNLKKSHFESLNIPLPPLNEQHRIAAKLDTTLAAVEACRQRLDGVAVILKRFRQAVLAAATSGELTREWREENFVDRKWEEGCLHELLSSKPRNGYSPKPADQETPIKSLTLSATTTGRFKPEHFKYIDQSIPVDSHLWLTPGDILIQRANTLEYVGISAIYNGPEKTFIYPDLMMKCQANDKVDTQYLHYLLLSEAVRNYFRESATGTSGNMPKINQQIVMSAPVRWPTYDEQLEIVERAQELFTLADQVESKLTVASTIVDRLTPALLAKAFRGELVPQDPTDEPAGVLLERIRAARQADAGAGKPWRRGRPKAAANPDQIAMDAAPVPLDFLAGLLRECGALSERALLAVSELEPKRFQQQLYRELESGTAREVQDNGQVLLEAVG
jgi:type I restriction enzyme, S subunit